MTTRKPDWADRMVEQQQDYGRVIAKSDAAALLRAYHQKVKRMVRKTGAGRMIRSYYTIAYKDACRDILAELKEMER